MVYQAQMHNPDTTKSNPRAVKTTIRPANHTLPYRVANEIHKNKLFVDGGTAAQDV